MRGLKQSVWYHVSLPLLIRVEWIYLWKIGGDQFTSFFKLNWYVFYNFFLYSFYPYIMMCSCFFLVITLLVYTIIPNLRPTKDGMEYSKLMLHFTLAMLMAFICMATVRLTPTLSNVSPGFCEFLGKYWIWINVTLKEGFKSELASTLDTNSN